MGNIFQNNLTTPMDIYFHLIDDKVLQIMVTETNIYAKQMVDSRITTRRDRLARWKYTDKN